MKSRKTRLVALVLSFLMLSTLPVYAADTISIYLDNDTQTVTSVKDDTEIKLTGKVNFSRLCG